MQPLRYLVLFVMFCSLGFTYQAMAQKIEAEPRSDGLTIHVEDVPSSEGQILIALYSEAEGFCEPETAAYTMGVEAQEGLKSVYLPDVPSGLYAIALVHDADDSGDITTGLFGIPQEAYGFGNDARGMFAPPSFVESVIDVQPGSEYHVRLH